MLRETVSGFTENEIAPLAAEIDPQDEFPRELWPKMGALGLLGLTGEEEFGGTGMGYLAHLVAMEEISRASAGIGLSYGAHGDLHRWDPAQRHRAQKRKYLPKPVNGSNVGASP